VAGCSECGDEPSGSGATELVTLVRYYIICMNHYLTHVRKHMGLIL
jgi:hypothetical protein